MADFLPGGEASVNLPLSADPDIKDARLHSGVKAVL